MRREHDRGRDALGVAWARSAASQLDCSAMHPGDILSAADVPDGALVCDGEGDCWVRFGGWGHLAFAPSAMGPPVRPWCGWDTRRRVPWARRGRFVVIATGLTPSSATAEHLQSLATDFERTHGALTWSDGRLVVARADDV